MENNTCDISLLEIPELEKLIVSTATIELAAGETLFQSGEPCNYLPLVMSGNARIYIEDKTFHQTTLYCLKPGDICTISLSALLQNTTYPAWADAETMTQVRYLSGKILIAAISSTPRVFRAFLDTLSDGLYDSERTARQLIFDPQQNQAAANTEQSAQR